MNDQQAIKLELPFQFNEIKWRVASTSKDKTRGLPVPYVDSRAAQHRLNVVLGRENWQNHFETISGSNTETSSFICTISIYYPERSEWISKSNGAGCTDFQPIKGGFSDAFKRAASMWGVGFYLYSFEDTWVDIDKRGNSYVVKDAAYGQLEKAYNRFIQQYSTSAHPSPSEPLPNTYKNKNEKTVPQCDQDPASPKLKPVYRVLTAKTKRNGNLVTTYVSLKCNDGTTVVGYINGDGVMPGQLLTDVQIFEKCDNAVGNYNIISNYKIAA